MRASVAVAVATGAIVIAFGGIAMAAEPAPAGDAVVPVTVSSEAPTAPPSEEPAEDIDTIATAGGGLECSLAPGIALDDILEPGAVDCSGTGNERSAEVALVPRYLAHAAELSGAERGAIISAWAKTHANQKSDEDGGDPEVDGDAAESGDAAAPATEGPPAPDTSPGRSGDAPGHGGTTPGNGRGR